VVITSNDDLEKYLDSIIDKKADIIFVIDSTGSMGAKISEVRSISYDFIDRLEELGVDFKLGLVSFRDYPQRCGSIRCGYDNDFPYKIYSNGNLTNNSEEFVTWLNDLDAKGGADAPESILPALRHCQEDIRWRVDSSRAAILITDSYPHPDLDCCNVEGDTLDKTINILASEGIRTYVVGPDKKPLKDISEETNGKFYAIRKNTTLMPILDDILGNILYKFHVKLEPICRGNRLDINVWLIGKGKPIPYFPGWTEAWLTYNNSSGIERINLSHKESGRYSAYIDKICDPARLDVFGRVGKWSANDTLVAFCGNCQQKITPVAVHSISGHVFIDKNTNGFMEPGESGLAEWKVTLDGVSDRKIVLSETTDKDGSYEFSDLQAGRYEIIVNARSGWNATSGLGSSRQLNLSTVNLTEVNFGFEYIKGAESVSRGLPRFVELMNATFSRWGWDDKFSEGGDSIQETNDGGYILAGLTGSKKYDTYGIWLIKTDLNGKLISDWVFDEPYYQHAHTVEQTQDGGYIIQGIRETNMASNTTFNKILLLKTDLRGKLVWENIYESSFVRNLGSLYQTSDHGYILTSDIASNDTQRFRVLLLKIATNGSKEWETSYGGSGDQMGNSVIQTSDGGYLIAGTTSSFEAQNYDFWLIKTDSSGKMVWNRTFGGSEKDVARIVRQCKDGGYILGGASGMDEGMSQKGDAWVIKIDSEGNKMWEWSFGEPGYLESAVGLEQTNDSGYIVGLTSTRGVNKLIKLDGNGSEECEFKLDYRLSSLRLTENSEFIVIGSIEDPLKRVQGLKMTRLKIVYD
jgi:hypothetical protein